MKKLLLILLLATALIACSKEGEITDQSTSHIIINGNEYRFVQIVPADGANAVWIMVPNDANVEVPRVTSQRISCGKNCHKTLSVVMVEK